MSYSEMRAQAREKLTGKWGKVAVMTLVFVILSMILSALQKGIGNNVTSIILSIAVIIITVPISFGFTFSLYKIFKGEEVGYFDFLSLGLSNFKKAWGIALHICLKLILPILLFVIANVLIIVSGLAIYNIDVGNTLNTGMTSIIGLVSIILTFVSMVWLTIRSFYYVIANFIAFDNLEISSKEAVEKSQKLMKGNRAKYFVLMLTFIGWIFLGSLSLGIGFLWLIPYIQFAAFAFYKHIESKEQETETKETVEAQ